MMGEPTRLSFGGRRDAEHRPRYRPVGSLPTFWRIVCGVCDGLIAEVDYGKVRPGRAKVLYDRGIMGPGLTEADASSGTSPDSWVTTHPRGLRRDDAERYHVIRDAAAGGGRWGDRKHPTGGARRMESGPFNIIAQGGWGIVGEFPTLPAVIICPDCQRPHRVDPPPG